MKNGKFIFAGNRYFVLEEMIERGLDVRIFAIRESWLEHTLQQQQLPFESIESKRHLIASLERMDFDFLIANGCPYILPISELQGNARTFINIHPGPLPDLRGADPVPGAILLGRDAGATCHLMDDGIDTGPIISRVVIPNTDELDAGLLYQLSFLAEKEVFNRAFEREFRPAPELQNAPSGVYYTRKERDLEIDFTESAAHIVRRVRAFSNRSQGARFSHDGKTWRVFGAERVANPWLMERHEAWAEGEIVLRYEDCLLIRTAEAFVKLMAIEGDLSALRPGTLLAPVDEAVPTAPRRAMAI